MNIDIYKIQDIIREDIEIDRGGVLVGFYEAAKSIEYLLQEEAFLWTTEKPDFFFINTPCLVICAVEIRGEWEYNLFQVKKTEFEEKWYWGWFTGDGEEYGDIDDMKADKYCVLPLLVK